MRATIAFLLSGCAAAPVEAPDAALDLFAPPDLAVVLRAPDLAAADQTAVDTAAPDLSESPDMNETPPDLAIPLWPDYAAPVDLRCVPPSNYCTPGETLCCYGYGCSSRICCQTFGQPCEHCEPYPCCLDPYDANGGLAICVPAMDGVYRCCSRRVGCL